MFLQRQFWSCVKVSKTIISKLTKKIKDNIKMMGVVEVAYHCNVCIPDNFFLTKLY